jgi:hypothetical protein
MPYLNLGFTPPADSFIREQGLSQPEIYYPLEVCLCEDCGISQLTYTVPPDVLYQHDYPYESSITRAGRAHFLNFASSVVSRFNLGPETLAIDIGSNVGVLLEGFKINGCRTLGIEPSANIAATAIGRKIETINDFISTKLASDIVSRYGKASAITATNVFAHIDDLDDLVSAIDILLDINGVFIIEAPHFLKLIKNLEYDTIYHEHLLYVSIRPLSKLFNRFGFEVFDVEEIGIHGGSVRIFVSRLGKYPISSKLIDMVSLETSSKIFDINRLTEFSKEVLLHRTELVSLLNDIKLSGHSIAAVSAPAKGMTLLNYCHLGSEFLDFVTEKSKLKIGLYTPGTHIKILPDSALAERQPDYALILAWNFSEEIMENLSRFRDDGGKFIIPIPHPHII